MKRARVLVAALVVLAIGLTLGACRGKSNPAESASPTTATPSATGTITSPTPTPTSSQRTIRVYYVKSGATDFYLVAEDHKVSAGGDKLLAAAEEAVHGKPLDAGAQSVYPAATRILSVRLDKGVATVDFSREVLAANVGADGESLGIAALVNTLTEFSEVTAVRFTVEGRNKGSIDGRAIEDWWGHVGLFDQPFHRDLSRVRKA